MGRLSGSTSEQSLGRLWGLTQGWGLGAVVGRLWGSNPGLVPGAAVGQRRLRVTAREEPRPSFVLTPQRGAAPGMAARSLSPGPGPAVGPRTTGRRRRRSRGEGPLTGLGGRLGPGLAVPTPVPVSRPRDRRRFCHFGRRGGGGRHLGAARGAAPGSANRAPNGGAAIRDRR